MAGKPGDQFDDKTQDELRKAALEDAHYHKDTPSLRLLMAKGMSVPSSHVLSEKTYAAMAGGSMALPPDAQKKYDQGATELQHEFDVKAKEAEREQAAKTLNERVHHASDMPGHEETTFKDGSTLSVYYGVSRNEPDSIISRNNKGEVIGLGTEYTTSGAGEKYLIQLRDYGRTTGSAPTMGSEVTKTVDAEGHVTYRNGFNDVVVDLGSRSVFTPAPGHGSAVEIHPYQKPELPAHHVTSDHKAEHAATPATTMFKPAHQETEFKDGSSLTYYFGPGDGSPAHVVSRNSKGDVIGFGSIIATTDGENYLHGLVEAGKRADTAPAIQGTIKTVDNNGHAVYHNAAGETISKAGDKSVFTPAQGNAFEIQGRPEPWPRTEHRSDGSTLATYADGTTLATYSDHGKVTAVVQRDAAGEVTALTGPDGKRLGVTKTVEGDTVTYASSAGIAVHDHRDMNWSSVADEKARGKDPTGTAWFLGQEDRKFAAPAADSALAAHAHHPHSSGLNAAAPTQSHLDMLHGSPGQLSKLLDSMAVMEFAEWRNGNYTVATDLHRLRNDLAHPLADPKKDLERLATDVQRLGADTGQAPPLKKTKPAFTNKNNILEC